MYSLAEALVNIGEMKPADRHFSSVGGTVHYRCCRYQVQQQAAADWLADRVPLTEPGGEAIDPNRKRRAWREPSQRGNRIYRGKRLLDIDRRPNRVLDDRVTPERPFQQVYQRGNGLAMMIADIEHPCRHRPFGWRSRHPSSPDTMSSI